MLAIVATTSASSVSLTAVYFWITIAAGTVTVFGFIFAGFKFFQHVRNWLVLTVAEPLKTITGEPSVGGRPPVVGLPTTVYAQGRTLAEHGQMLTEHGQKLDAIQDDLGTLIHGVNLIGEKVTPNGGDTDNIGDMILRLERDRTPKRKARTVERND